MTAEATARPATPDDLDVLEHMATAAVAEQADARGGWVWSRRETRPSPVRDSFGSSFDDSSAQIWIGTFDGAEVGFASAHVEELRDGSRLAVIDEIYVEPEAREVAVGEALVTAVDDWARDRSCVGIDAWALPGNRGTKNFFESFGFTARGIVVHRRLEPR